MYILFDAMVRKIGVRPSNSMIKIRKKFTIKS